MLYCSCGKALDRVPDWLSSVNVEFVCNNCPNRKVKNISAVTLEPEVAPTSRVDVVESPEGEPEDEEE